jgi:hypothetical protein
MKTLLFIALAVAAAAAPIRIDLVHNTPREQQTKTRLEGLLASYDLTKYTFTRKVLIEERAINHAFPTLTLNVRFANSDDELLSSYVHEQLHWWLRQHEASEREAVAILRKMYPNAPVGAPEGAETSYSTYGHLVDCYLEIQADRQLIGPERTSAVVKNKGHYTWIYGTILRDEPRIAAIVGSYHLQIK